MGKLLYLPGDQKTAIRKSTGDAGRAREIQDQFTHGYQKDVGGTIGETAEALDQI